MNIVWKWLLSPAVLGFSLVTLPAVAESSLENQNIFIEKDFQLEASKELSSPSEEEIPTEDLQAGMPPEIVPSLPGKPPTAVPDERLMVQRIEPIQRSGLTEGENYPITQVSDLVPDPSDPLRGLVEPTHWAYQALRSLVERYGCIAGYPDGTFRGNRALTRYEFAAGLNACLDRIGELIKAGTTNLVTQEDLAAVQRLQEQFAAELATLRGRVDALEVRTAELEANQFSTTTKLNGEVIFGLTSVMAGEDANGKELNESTILGSRVRLNFDTSFTGEDLLRTRIQAINLNSFSTNSTLTPEGELRFNAGPFGEASNDAVLDALLYSFPIGDNTTVILEANAGAADDFTNTVNPFFDGDGSTGALSNFGTRNPIYYLLGGAGIAVRHQFGDRLELSGGYLASDAANPSRGGGLFNGPYGALAQLTFTPSDRFAVGLTYVHSYGFTTGTGSNNANLPSVLDRDFGIDLPVSSNSYGIQASWQPSSRLSVGGWVGYTAERLLSSGEGLFERGDRKIWNWAVTLAFPDLLKEGNVAGLLVGMEPKVTSTSNDSLPKDRDTSLHIEGFYQFQLTDNIAITPGLIWLTAPDHNNDNSDIVIGVVRTTLTF